MAETPDLPSSVPDLTESLAGVGYLADRGLATSLYVGLHLGRPVLLEGEVGVGKTEVAKAMAAVLGRRLIRLQCYEGIDSSQALYEWDYARQMLQIRAMSERRRGRRGRRRRSSSVPSSCSNDPCSTPCAPVTGAVLLIDEVDRADDEFEAFLLELLSDFQITIPEIGTVVAERPPFVVLTSNRTRELHDALKRRCLYHWVGYPERRARGRDRAGPRARRHRGPGPQGRRRRQPAAGARAGEAARRRGDDRLGPLARRPRRRRPRPGGRGRHASARSSRSATTSSR